MAQIGLAKELLEQTEKKLAGQRSIRDRIVSFFDPHARAIVKGKLDKPVEFGRTMELVQDDSGVIVHYEVHPGNPSDKVHLLSLVRQTKKVLNQSPQELAADRGFYSAQNLRKLRRLKVRRVGIPKIGRLTPSETNINAPNGLENCSGFVAGSKPPSACLNVNSVWAKCWPEARRPPPFGPAGRSLPIISGNKPEMRLIPNIDLISEQKPLYFRANLKLSNCTFSVRTS
jgi:IS5 family transposase